VDHITLSDPLTWAGILVASFLLAGLRFFVRGGARPPAPAASPSAEDETLP
jgi:hypothetical protein